MLLQRTGCQTTVILARLAGGFQAPLVKAAGLFQAFTRNFAYGLKALIDTLPAEAEAPGDEPAAESEAAGSIGRIRPWRGRRPGVSETEPEPAPEPETETVETEETKEN